jgi:hypothetical protein
MPLGCGRTPETRVAVFLDLPQPIIAVKTSIAALDDIGKTTEHWKVAIPCPFILRG